MNYRRLGKTDLMVSEIGFGCEWMERHSVDEVIAAVKECEKQGINIMDIWMSEPNVRTNIGIAIKETREKWFIQGHIGSTWQDGQYVRTRNLEKAKEAFEDLIERLQTDYIDLGMIHYVDKEEDWNNIQESDYLAYIKELKEKGIIRHIGLSTHNPEIAIKAAESGFVEMVMFSVNPAFDMMPAMDDVSNYFKDTFDEKLGGMDPIRAKVYQTCEANDVGITVMKGYAGGRLLDEKRSPFGVALTPVQCIHYCLTRPAVAAVMAGYDTPEHIREAIGYETATMEEKDYASVLAGAPAHSYHGQCTYCGHCKPCPMDIDIAMVNKLYDLAVMQKEVPESLKIHHNEMEHNAHDCIGCGGCETRCPFGVKIAERMGKAAKLFE